MPLRRFHRAKTLAATIVATASLLAQSTSPNLYPSAYQAMRWRQIGPFRAGRDTAVAGIPGNAAVYYMGTPGGGVWKTVDGGVVWTPIFDQVPVSSIGAIAVAPSQPATVYVGTGDVSMVGGSVNQGKGVYKSTDAGKTWQHLGLDDTEHIGNMWVDPRNPNTVVVAALGRTYSKSEQRGVFKTTDGGRTWKKVLYKDDTTGAVDIVFAPSQPNIGYVALMEHYTRPGTRAAIESTGTAGIFKTTDGGDTWNPLTEGLPSGRLGRIGLATNSDGTRVFAIVAGGGAPGAAGLYRSDDAGAHWAKSTPDLVSSAAAISPAFSSTPATPTPSTSPKPLSTAPTTAATPSPLIRAPPAATTTTPSGSTPPTPSA